MAFTMNIRMSGSAFHDEDTDAFRPGTELARILREVAANVEEWEQGAAGPIRDVCGNVVGYYETVEDF